MRIAGRRLGVAARLALLLGGVAAVTTALALLLQDRALDADLTEAAQERLMRAGSAADRLVDDHLRTVAERYSAISHTPEFRANLDVRHEPTLRYYASRLAEREHATSVAFLTPEGTIVASAGVLELAAAAVATTVTGRGDEQLCVAAADDTTAAESDGRAGRCDYPSVAAEASLFWWRDRLFVLAAVPLRTRGLLTGGLVAVESVEDQVLTTWSAIVGADVEALPTGAVSTAELVAVIRTLPGAGVWVSTTYGAERRALARSRRNLLLSGAAALLLAVLVSLGLARRVTQPLVLISSAVMRGEAGTMDSSLDVARDDELGELGRAFRNLVTRLRGRELELSRVRRQARRGLASIGAGGVNDADAEFRRLFRLPDGALVPIERLIAAVHEQDRDRLRAALDRALGGHGTLRIDIRVPIRAGRDRMLHMRGQLREVADEARLETSVQDITLRWESSQRIKYLSRHDVLTGLGNRDLLLEHLESSAREDHDASFTVFTIGLNHFATITGTVGPTAADVLLCEVARRLLICASDPEGSADANARDLAEGRVTRLGSAEFAVLKTNCSAADAQFFARTILAELDLPYEHESETIHIDASIGICRWPDDAPDIETLIANGHAALEQARITRQPRYEFYHDAMHHEAARRLRMVPLLRRAVDHGELTVHYQPRVRPSDGRVVAVEALSRWQSSELGVVSPSEFIPLAEESGFITALGEWCLGVAARDLARWQAMGANDLRVAVNVSGYQLTTTMLQSVIQATPDIHPGSLELEITESAVIQHGDRAITVLHDLGEYGFRISLDDFGTGYSSLSHIRSLPIDAVKIDQSFIRELATSEDAHAMTWAIVMMCQALQLEAVAEGVETAAQRERLVEMDCDEAQGYLFAPPMAAEQLEAFLTQAGVFATRPSAAKHAAPTRKAKFGRSRVKRGR